MAQGGAHKKDEWSEIEAEFTCPICEEIFTQPKTIPCLHTFCEQCIRATIEASERLGNELRCPVCRAELPRDVETIPTNFSTKRLIEIYRRKRQNSLFQETVEELKCEECEENCVAEKWCVDCDSPLCGECHKQHGRMKKFKSHKTMTVENFMHSPKTILSKHKAVYHCDDHTAQPLDLYCVTCSCLICRDCTYVDHREHQYNFVYKLADIERDKIKVIATPLKKMLEQVRAGLEKVEERDNEIDGRCEAEVIKPIQDTYQRLHEILQEQEASDLRKVDIIKNTLHSSLGGQIKELKLLEEWLVSCDEFVTKATTSQRPNELLTYSKYISNRVAELTGQVERTNLDPVCGIDDLILSTSNPDDYASQLTPVCSVSTLPHVANCSVKGPAAMSKYGPVKLTVTLKDKDGLLVPNQSEHLRVEFKRENLVSSVKVELISLGVYTLSYRPKRREAHSLYVLWKKQLLKEVHISLHIQDYTAIQQELQVITNYGPGAKQLRHPYLMANGPNNELVIRDFVSKHLVVFDDQLKYSHTIGEGICDWPTGLAVSKKGYLYAQDHLLQTIQKFNMSGELLCRLGSPGSDECQFRYPHGILLSQSDVLFVCDSGNHRIQVFEDDQFIYSFGKKGHQPGHFDCPFDLVLNTAEDQLFITELYNNRVQVFTPNGQFLRVFVENFADVPLVHPTGICFTPDGHVMVSSRSTDCVMIFEEDGNCVSVIRGTFQGKKRFSAPIGVLLRHNGQLLVAGDTSNSLAVFKNKF